MVTGFISREALFDRKGLFNLNYLHFNIFLTCFSICLNFVVLDSVLTCFFYIFFYDVYRHYSQGHHYVRDGVAEVGPQLHLPPQAGQSDRSPCPRYPTLG
jgi:hypothetical protein